MGEKRELPEGWEYVQISDVFEVNPRKPPADHLPSDAPVSFVPMAAVDERQGVIAATEVREFGAVRKGYTAFQNQDVILAKITPCMENGKAAVARGLMNGLGFGSTEFHVLRPTGAASPDYLFYFLRQKSFRRAAAAEMTGSVGQKRVPADYLGGLGLPLPPLVEQRRIVAKLEEVLAQVNAAHERLEKVPAILKRFRQSVLAAACSGRLTEGWRDEHPNVEAAEELLKQMRAERLSRWKESGRRGRYRGATPMSARSLPGVPVSWCWTTFDECSEEITVGHVGPMRDQYVAEGVPFLRSQNVRPLRFDPTGLVYIPVPFHTALNKSRLVGGEILTVRSGANTGDCCVYPIGAPEANCADLVITRPLSGLNPEYGAIYIRSPKGRARLNLGETGIAQPHFNIGAMRQKALPLPPHAEQQEIARRVETLFAWADGVENHVEAVRGRVEKLEQAVLAKAFRGELVPTEAELALREGRDYEPASVLLERIRKERASANPRAKRGRGRRHRAAEQVELL